MRIPWGRSTQQWKYLWSTLVVVIVIMAVVIEACYRGCQCTMVGGTKKKQRGKRMDCSKHAAPITAVEHITIQADTVVL